jgi:hypothetical protein
VVGGTPPCTQPESVSETTELCHTIPQLITVAWSSYIRLCREVAEKVSGNEGVRTVEQLRKFLSQLYWDASIQPNGGCSMTAIGECTPACAAASARRLRFTTCECFFVSIHSDIQNSEKEFLLFAEQYSGEVTSASSASRKGAGDDEFTEETVYEFLTKKVRPIVARAPWTGNPSRHPRDDRLLVALQSPRVL